MKKVALILVDFINEIVDEKGKLAGKGYAAFVQAHRTLQNVQAAIDKAHAKSIPVVFVTLGFKPDYSDWPEDSPLFGAAKKFEALQSGTWATMLHPVIKKGSNDFLLVKNRVSAFWKTDLEKILIKEGVGTVMIGGVATDLAVQSTARDAHDRDFRVIVLEDLCAAANDDDHESTLKLLAKIATITHSTEVDELN